MDFDLQNLRTGDHHPLTPDGTLIGAADHAAVRTADGGPFLAALCVCYPGGWAVHGLSADPAVKFNYQPLTVGRPVAPRPGDVLEVGDDLFRFVSDEEMDAADEPLPAALADRPPTFFAYLRDPEGMEECRVVDHDLLIGRMPVCHVRFPDRRLSRYSALLAAHGGEWYVHALSKNPIVAVNRRLVTGFAPLDDGDELLVGPLSLRVEIGGPSPPDDPDRTGSAGDAADHADGADSPSGFDTAEPSDSAVPPDQTIRAAGHRLDQWLKSQSPGPAPEKGFSGWLIAQREKISRFWYDTPEATAARSLRAAGRADDAFAVLDRAVRARPDSPALLRELYRLYEAVGLTDLCYRPLRQIEKLAAARGSADPWVLETLARLCVRLGRNSPAMFDRAIRYWDQLEAATGVSYARERAAAAATKTLRDGGYAGPADDGA